MAFTMDALDRYQEAPVSQREIGAFNAAETMIMVGGGALGTYHGYKRYKGSFWGTALWGIFGAAVPPLAIPVMFIQGFGKPAE